MNKKIYLVMLKSGKRSYALEAFKNRKCAIQKAIDENNFSNYKFKGGGSAGFTLTEADLVKDGYYVKEIAVS